MLTATDTQSSSAKIVHSDEREFRWLVALTFVFFFFIAAVTRLLPRAWRPFSSSSASYRESVYAEAKRAAYTAIPFAFMR